MIRINLLPVRAARKKENIRRQVSVFLLTVFFGICVMAYLAFSLTRNISGVNDDIEVAQKELAELEVINIQIRELKDKLATLEAKMDVIQTLESNRTGAVRVMDLMTSLVIRQKMWLSSLTETGGRMILQGMAVDNKTVADFMTRLQRSPFFDQVVLVASRLTPMGPDNKFMAFNITCQALTLQPPAAQVQ
ncbi:MAG: PilN domain-containing protein [Deltaproteobacteria bacterium]|nr:PilN domain-containing protein [Deltaproteobacteria bacterium]